MKQKPLETILYSGIGVAAMLLVIVAVNVIAGAVNARFDLTEEKLFTLSDGTRAILGNLESPVTIRYYQTRGEAMPVYLQIYAQRVSDLLDEYREVAGNNLIIEKFDPQPDSDAADAARINGVEPRMTQTGDPVYLGLVVSQLDQKDAIPFLTPEEENLLEYNITRRIASVANPEKGVIGVMSGLPVFGQPANPMMMRMGQQGSEPWTLISELQRDFEVREVDLAAERIPEDVRVLVVIHPKDVSDATQYAIDQFLLRGGKVIAFLDAMSLSDPSSQQNPMFGQMPGGGSSLPKLLSAWGIEFENSQVVADMIYKMQLMRGNQPADAPTFLGVTGEGINSEDIATSQINEVWLPFAGAFSGTPVSGLTRTVLLKSTANSQLVDGFMAHMGGENIVNEFQSSGNEQTLALRLQGNFKTAFPQGPPDGGAEEEGDADADSETEEPSEASSGGGLKESTAPGVVVLFADADMLADQFTVRQYQTPFGRVSQSMNGNLSLAQNLVEQLAGDANLINLRSRASLSRPFTVVKEMEEKAQEKYRAQLKQLQDDRAEAQRRINELQAQKQPDQRFILSPEQQQELERLRNREVEANQKLKELRRELRKEADSLVFWTKFMNIVLMPAGVALVGVVLAVVKRSKTAAK
ncbi:MAG TPA: Gldg family protein [Methylomirabilota bacterium]|nr:Gldg family protein [Methylomirabilota bacterium]